MNMHVSQSHYEGRPREGGGKRGESEGRREMKVDFRELCKGGEVTRDSVIAMNTGISCSIKAMMIINCNKNAK